MDSPYERETEGNITRTRRLAIKAATLKTVCCGLWQRYFDLSNLYDHQLTVQNSSSMGSVIPTRVMVISDTHEHSLDGSLMPQVDVLLHTGDLTNFGELESLRDSIGMMGTIDAELKLVIAGNHDLTLDPTNRIENMPDEEYAEYHRQAIEIMTGQEAKKAGITYLEEGTYNFQLQNGTSFKVYASADTPGVGGWAFQYDNDDDIFNCNEQAAGARTPKVSQGMPAGVDIVMTHGPPLSILDQIDGKSLGCPRLLTAIARVKPLMHCFGHIHEGHGAHIVTWKDGRVKDPERATPLETEQINEYPHACEWSIRRGSQTLTVNAALLRNTGRGMRPDYQLFVVLLDLPVQ
jgi:Icc-related predicted phosphoesterase